MTFKSLFPVFIVLLCVLFIGIFTEGVDANIYEDTPVLVESNLDIDSVMSLNYPNPFNLTCKYTCVIECSPVCTDLGIIHNAVRTIKEDEVYSYTNATSTARNDSGRHDITGHSSYSLDTGIYGIIAGVRAYPLKCPIIV